MDTGVVFLPVETPYDQDVLFEYLQSIASAHRQVEVELEWLCLRVSESDCGPHRCERCDRRMASRAAHYLIAHRDLCARCARAVVRAGEHDLEWPAERGEHGYDRLADREL